MSSLNLLSGKKLDLSSEQSRGSRGLIYLGGSTKCSQLDLSRGTAKYSQVDLGGTAKYSQLGLSRRNSEVLAVRSI